ncbi:MAG: hypothetical protein AAB724_00165 [Patescibacteria group bacterium]
MKWVAISGTWRVTNRQVEGDVREAVRQILKNGNGIVTGGALGVDYFATDEAIICDPSCANLKIFLPVPIKLYFRHYRQRALEEVITFEQAENLILQLMWVRDANHKAIIENKKNTIVDKTTYFERNQSVIDASDELYAFQVNNSEGVGDTINKAKAKGIPIKKFIYTV